MKLASIKFRILLLATDQLLKRTARKYPSFKARLKEKNFTAQIKVVDNSIGRYFTFSNGKITSKSGIHANPEVCMGFSDAALASRLLMPWRNQLEQTNAMKNFRLTLDGPDELTWWFMETLSQLFSSGIDYGIDVGNNTKRYVSNSNAGAIFVGKYSAVACGDYAVGTNHVLPTAGYAKTYSGLDVSHFCKTTSVEMIDKNGLEAIGDVVETIAEAEGLHAHAQSVKIRRQC